MRAFSRLAQTRVRLDACQETWRSRLFARSGSSDFSPGIDKVVQGFPGPTQIIDSFSEVRELNNVFRNLKAK